MIEGLAAPAPMTEKEHTLLKPEIRDFEALKHLSAVSAFKWCESFDPLFEILEHTKMIYFTENFLKARFHRKRALPGISLTSSSGEKKNTRESFHRNLSLLAYPFISAVFKLLSDSEANGSEFR